MARALRRNVAARSAAERKAGAFETYFRGVSVRHAPLYAVRTEQRNRSLASARTRRPVERLKVDAKFAISGILGTCVSH